MSKFEQYGWIVLGTTMMIAGVLTLSKGLAEWILHRDGYNDEVDYD